MATVHPPAPTVASAARHAPRRRIAAIKAPKARTAAQCERLEQLPNVGPAVASALRRIGIHHPSDLHGQDALTLFHRLAEADGRRPDPCVLDTFLAATDFMAGAEPAPWWAYTARRKAGDPGPANPG